MIREFDVIVFGATGVTGRYAVEQMHKSSKEEGLTFAVAGRSEGKLIDALKEVASWLGEDPEAFSRQIPKIVADVSDAESLRKMARRARIIVNTVGPYRFYGEAVVSACVDEATNYVDVSGEPQFIEKMQLKYHQAAKEKKIYLVSACGFDSIPCELTFNFAKENFRGQLNSVETFLSFASPKGGHTNTGTWNSAIHGVASWSELAPLRKQITETLFPKKLQKPKFKQPKRGFVSTSPLLKGGYAIPFMGSDRSVVIKSEMFRHESADGDSYQPVQIQTFMRLPGLLAVMVLAMVGAVFGVLAQFAFGRRLLENHPALFSLGLFRQGAPARDQLLAKSMKIVAHGRGWHSDEANSAQPPTAEVVVEMQGPDPAYIGTSIMLVQSAVCVLKEAMAMPFSGGCLSPGFAFEKTTLRKRLEARGFKFFVIRQS